jgi:hypothetical protein
MMDNPYNIHSWSKQYREETLLEARTRHLVDRARTDRNRLSRRSLLSLAWTNVLSQLHRM